MTLNEARRENWEKLQERYNHPVDALGRPIDQMDHDSLHAWRSEGMDKFMQK